MQGKSLVNALTVIYYHCYSNSSCTWAPDNHMAHGPNNKKWIVVLEQVRLTDMMKLSLSRHLFTYPLQGGYCIFASLHKATSCNPVSEVKDLHARLQAYFIFSTIMTKKKVFAILFQSSEYYASKSFVFKKFISPVHAYKKPIRSSRF